MIRSLYMVLTISLSVMIFGCASMPTDPRIKPSIANDAMTRVGKPAYPIKDKNLLLMYNRIRQFGSVPWEQREKALFDIVSNKISKSEVDKYNQLLDMDQLVTVSQYLGMVNTSVQDNCRWFKPPKRNLTYVRGGSCDNGYLAGNVEFAEIKKGRNYSWWVLMAGGEALKGVRGQSKQQKAISKRKIKANPFHNWSRKQKHSQVEPLGLGHLDKNFNWHGLAAEQGDGKSSRYIAEHIDGAQIGWGARIKLRHAVLEGEAAKLIGLSVKYVGQMKNYNWDGVGVRVSEIEYYITPQGHWVPKDLEFSLGWEVVNNKYKSNGATVKYYAAYYQGYGQDQPASIYYGYNKNNKREGAGGHERISKSQSSVMIGAYENNKKAGYHRWYQNGRAMGNDDWCYSTRAHPCKTGGDGFGKFLALAGGAVLAGSSSMDSAQKLDFMSNYTADVLTDSGGTNTQKWANNGFTSSTDINDPLNPNNPINKRMSEQVKRNVGLHEQKQQQAKQEYAAQLKQRSQQINQQRAASLKNTSFTNNSQQQAVSHQPSSSAVTKSKYSGMSFAAKDDETEAKEPDKEKVEAPPVALSKGEMFGDSEEYYYSKKSSMNIAQIHLQNNTAEFCGSSLKSRLSWHDSSTTCKEKNEQFRCKVYAAATCFDKACDTFFCGTKR